MHTQNRTDITRKIPPAGRSSQINSRIISVQRNYKISVFLKDLWRLGRLSLEELW